MKLHFLVEGTSEAAFIEAWAPRLLKGHEIRTYPHEGKGKLPEPDQKVPAQRRGLLDQLPAKLRAYGRSLDRNTEAVVVLVDADSESCAVLRSRLNRLLSSVSPAPNVLFRIAIEELEAYYLGDLGALKNAYPEHDHKAAREYQPDSICGTAELFGRIIADGGMNKVSWAKVMGPKVTISQARSRSPSFRKLVSGLKALVAPVRKSASTRRKRKRVASKGRNTSRRKR